MIQINRRPTVPVSIRDGSKIKNEYEIALNDWRVNGKNGKPPKSKYNQDDVKLTLMEDFNNKCGFCEREFERGNLQIEHYKPKKHFPDLALDWNNLLLACQPCNSKKGSSFDTRNPIINPCDDEPKKFFKYRLDEHETGKKLIHIVPKRGTPENQNRTKNTIKTCNLNRDGLLIDRAKRFSDAKSHKIAYDTGQGGDYHIRYVLNQKNEEYLGVLDFFGILP